MSSGLDTLTTQDAVLAYAKEQIPAWPFEEGEWPDALTPEMQNAVLDGYVLVRFTDALLPNTSDQNFGGPVYDGYYGLIQFQCASASPRDARTIMNKVNQVFIGWTPDENTGLLTKQFGGGAYTIPATNSSPQFSVAICSFRYQSNMQQSA